jgi:hypothetical protein
MLGSCQHAGDRAPTCASVPECPLSASAQTDSHLGLLNIVLVPHHSQFATDMYAVLDETT